MTSSSLCLDTNFLVGLFDSADVWHRNARQIYLLLQNHQVEIAYFDCDCVLNELFSVLARRCRERGETQGFSALVSRVTQVIPDSAITWLYSYLPDWYGRCLSVMQDSEGRLNFHDALIAVAIQELQFSALVISIRLN